MTRLVKYMGSKHAMLANGLGQIIVEESRSADRIVDLFCGGSSVAWFAAENTKCPVFASDLQHYAVVLAKSVIGRTNPINPIRTANNWFDAVHAVRDDSENWYSAQALDASHFSVAQYVEESRVLCGSMTGSGPTWMSYGGYYFTPKQAATIDAMLSVLPDEEPLRTICLAATISSGSHCSASPGHTAQPFQATPKASPYIVEAWRRDPLELARKALERICVRSANVVGEAVVGEAVSIASSLTSSDLAIVDPPYSGVQYSRFYHVLETIARGVEESVTGKGRYPPIEARPQSAFSNRGKSKEALVCLLENLSVARARVVFTFPSGASSNGLSGDTVAKVAESLFDVEFRRTIAGRFSTLGGNNKNRAARSDSEELVLLMRN